MKKSISKIIAIILSAIMCLSGITCVAFAENIWDNSWSRTVDNRNSQIAAPVNIEHTLSGWTSNLKLSLTWDAVQLEETETDDEEAPIVQYAVMINDEVTTGITAAAYVVKSLDAAQENIIKVGAYIDEEYISWNDDEIITTPIIQIAPVTLSSVSKPAKNDNKLTVKWQLPEGTEYAKFAIVDNGNVKINNIAASKRSYTYRASGGKHKILIRAYSTEYPTVFSKSNIIESASIKSYLTSVHKKFIWRATFTKKATLYKDSARKTSKGTVKKGAVAEAIGKYPAKVGAWEDPTMIKVELSNGKTGWVNFDTIKLKALVKPNSDYSKSTKQEFVKNYSSKTSYLVWVNQYTMRMNVFTGKKGNWKLYKTKRCVVGEFRMPLSYGSKYSLNNCVGRVYRVDEEGESYYFDYARNFHGSGYFHTRCRWSIDDSLRNSIGSIPSTRGCVRLYDEDAIFIYGLPKGTKVVIY